MARSIWSGALSFGLVSIPVSLYPATQDHQVRFHQLEQGSGSRVRYQRVNQDTGQEVPYSDIVKGADTGDGGYVVLTNEELESAEPGGGHTVDITDFVDASEIDPIYFEKSYYLGPRDNAARQPYALLLKAIEDAGQIAVATFVLRSKQHLAAIRAHAGVLVLETMHFADEVRRPEDIVNPPDTTAMRQRDLDMAKQLIQTMQTSWQPEQYHDTYNDRVRELIEAKSRNETIPTPEGQPGAEVVDLTQALRASINQQQGNGEPAAPVESSNRSRAGTSRKRSDGQQKFSARESAASGAAESADDLSRMSKSQLYDLAQRAGIPGRSGMTREALKQALSPHPDDAERQAS